ncbi:MAG: hypothetical protein GWN84_18585 [Gammaproteobacteria bacterium]|nr:hypothetical protein [Gammaproteobacteria bacterium]NIR84838.1 hypothetical protein [Gammaproteobacteria bacterium]NIR91552.1 hypothetical protein [Gammaproteobacteria bacterium]NIU05885.1 hypothetical protein [Gammaproteobacteria bacterium]NIV76740.1 hypothetical protein [Gammaproteobacteria bacterium]
MGSPSKITDILDDIIHLDPEDPEIDDPVMVRLAGAVRTLRPQVEDAMRRHGSGPALAALIALVTNKALRESEEQAASIAQALREHAELLEVRAHIHEHGGRA